MDTRPFPPLDFSDKLKTQRDVFSSLSRSALGLRSSTVEISIKVEVLILCRSLILIWNSYVSPSPLVWFSSEHRWNPIELFKEESAKSKMVPASKTFTSSQMKKVRNKPAFVEWLQIMGKLDFPTCLALRLLVDPAVPWQIFTELQNLVLHKFWCFWFSIPKSLYCTCTILDFS